MKRFHDQIFDYNSAFLDQREIQPCTQLNETNLINRSNKRKTLHFCYKKTISVTLHFISSLVIERAKQQHFLFQFFSLGENG